jgi:AraC-like DNA-binding protein
MIPAQTPKPLDGRKERGESIPADNAKTRAFDNPLGPDATPVARNSGFAVYRLENATGSGIVSVYDVFPGVTLFYNDLHLRHIAGHDEPRVSAADMLVINHCREGRFECEFPNGACGCLGEGDLAVGDLPPRLKASSFPLSHYHGISIILDVSAAAKIISDVCEPLRITPIDLRAVKTNLLGERPYFLVRETDTVAHIFAELYNAPPELKESYIRLKLVELLLFLSSAKPEPAERRYFYKTRVDAVKALRDHITSNLERRFTLPELSKLFDIPPTAMKTCFKAVCGAPIGEYIREYRLQTAAVLLRETSDPIAEISAKVGYDSHAKFSAAFREYVNAAPSEYRKIAVRKE